MRDYNYKVPLMLELLQEHVGDTIFISLDQVSSYMQWLIRLCDIHKVTFIWRGQHYSFLRACFGVKIMTSKFQAAMTAILRGIEKVTVFVDDILIAGSSVDSIVRQCRLVLERLNEYHIRINFDKSIFGARKVLHLGRELSAAGFGPDGSRVKEIMNWPLPRTRKELHSFVQSANYYRDHIPNFGLLAGPLTQEMLGKGNVVWTSTMKQAVQRIKDGFRDFVTLAFPDFTLPFIIHVDASKEGIGAVLSQRIDPTKRERIILCASRQFRGAELNYSTTKKELWGLIWALKKFESLVLGGEGADLYRPPSPHFSAHPNAHESHACTMGRVSADV